MEREDVERKGKAGGGGGNRASKREVKGGRGGIGEKDDDSFDT